MNCKFMKLFLCLPVFLVFFGCGDNGSQTTVGPLPSDPNEWVCQDSATDISQVDINLWCESNSDRGEPAPSFLRTPPPL